VHKGIITNKSLSQQTQRTNERTLDQTQELKQITPHNKRTKRKTRTTSNATQRNASLG